jgi:hypothetical protein
LSALDQTIKIIGDEKKPPGAIFPIDIEKLGRSQAVGHRMTGNRNGQSAPAKVPAGEAGWNGRRRAPPNPKPFLRTAAARSPFLHNYNSHRPHFGINGCPLSQGSQQTTYRDT